MKNEIRLALLCLATASVPAFAQGTLPRCGSANFDQARSAFTVKNASAGTVNQQCLITVYPKGAMPPQASQDPASYLVEGTYAIELVGGGGGGGGGSKTKGGGGGAGAAISRTSQYLAPGDYKMTLGTGGEGGAAGGGRTGSGNPSSLTNASTGQLVAGFAGADVATARTEGATGGSGGIAKPGGSSGGAGGRDSTPAQPGGMSQSSGAAMPGQAGAENNPKRDEAGGGGGASVGKGGTGQSEEKNTVAGAGQRGGHGQIKLTLTKPAPDMIAAPPAAVATAPAYVAPADTQAAPMRKAKKDRN